MSSQQRIALITGGNRGIGRSTALALAAKGVDSVITYRSHAEECDAVVGELEALGRKAVALQLDTGDTSQFEAFSATLAGALQETWGRDTFDYLVNNAGNSSNHGFTEVTEEEFDGLVDIHFKDEDDISERVIFPITLAQANGIEDARFLAFEDEGRRTYYATYTAYSGGAIRSELLETTDFRSFRMTPLRGAAAANKGMGLFPRKIDGRYAMIGRQDNENLYLIYSSNLLSWNGGTPILKPKFPWEFVQIGTCGAPIELDEGWLLLIHGVGPVRKYAIGAVLLDLSDPSRVLGRSTEPLVRPEPSEREGYVPNVVYTCGAMRQGSRLIVPYAVSDTFSTVGTVEIDALLKALQS